MNRNLYTLESDAFEVDPEFKDYVQELTESAFKHQWVRTVNQHYVRSLHDVSRKWILENPLTAFELLPQLQAFCYVQLKEDFNFTDSQIERMRTKLSNYNWALASFDKAKVIKNQYFRGGHFPSDENEMLNHALSQACACNVVVVPRPRYKKKSASQQRAADRHNLVAGAQQLAMLRMAKIHDLMGTTPEAPATSSELDADNVMLSDDSQPYSLDDVLESIKDVSSRLKEPGLTEDDTKAIRSLHRQNSASVHAKQRWEQELEDGVERGLYSRAATNFECLGYRAHVVLYAPPNSGKTYFCKSGPWFDTDFQDHWLVPNPSLIVTNKVEFLSRGDVKFALLPTFGVFAVRCLARGLPFYPRWYFEVKNQIPANTYVVRSNKRLAELLIESGFSIVIDPGPSGGS